MQDQDCLVVIPVGFREAREDVEDTAASVLHYLGPEAKLLLAMAHDYPHAAQLSTRLPWADILPVSLPPGAAGRLWHKLAYALDYAVSRYRFEVLLKMDVDALVIGPRPQDDAAGYFRAHPRAGMLGAYKLKYNGRNRDFSPQYRHFRRDLTEDKRQLARFGTGYSARNRLPLRAMLILRVLEAKRRADYQLGESVLGGAYFLSSEAVAHMARRGDLSRPRFGESRADEDAIFSLLVKSTGLALVDYGFDGCPMAMSWKALPASPHELVTKGKKVVHSVRAWHDWDEATIRRYFREKRQAETPSSAGALNGHV